MTLEYKYGAYRLTGVPPGTNRKLKEAGFRWDWSGNRWTARTMHACFRMLQEFPHCEVESASAEALHLSAETKGYRFAALPAMTLATIRVQVLPQAKVRRIPPGKAVKK